MKVFERNGKINFVDDNNVFVGFDYESICCENFGYYLIYKGEKIDCDFDLDGYTFYTSYCEEKEGELDYCEENEVTFKLIKDECEPIFLSLFNHHNGYYAHGFEMGVINGENYFDGVL